MLIALLFVSALALAFANGANDNFKAVATVYGSGDEERISGIFSRPDSVVQRSASSSAENFATTREARPKQMTLTRTRCALGKLTMCFYVLL